MWGCLSYVGGGVAACREHCLAYGGYVWLMRGMFGLRGGAVAACREYCLFYVLGMLGLCGGCLDYVWDV